MSTEDQSSKPLLPGEGYDESDNDTSEKAKDHHGSAAASPCIRGRVWIVCIIATAAVLSVLILSVMILGQISEELKSANNEISELKQYYKEVNETLNMLIPSIMGQINDQISNLRKELEPANDEISELKQNFEELNKTLNHLVQMDYESHIRTTVDDLVKNATAMDEALTRIIGDNGIFKAQLANNEISLKTHVQNLARDLNGNFSAAIEILASDINDARNNLSSKVNACNEKITLLTPAVENTEVEISSLQNKTDELYTKDRDHEKNIACLDANVTAMQIRFSSYIRNTTSRFIGLENTLDSSAKQSMNGFSQADIISDLTHLKNNVSTLANDCRRDQQQTTQKLEKSIKSKTSELEMKLESRINDVDNHVVSLDTKQVLQSDSIDDLKATQQSDIKNMDKKLAHLTHNLQYSNKSHTDHIDSLNSTTKSNNAAIATLNSKQESFQQKIENSTDKKINESLKPVKTGLIVEGVALIIMTVGLLYICCCYCKTNSK